MEAADATGIPYLKALSRCVIGTAYLEVGGPMIERALQYHDETSSLMELPTGTTYGTWMWSEMGTCALAARKIDDAQAVFDLALKENTATMFLMRPAALLGACQLALTLGQIDRARELYAEADEYVTSHAMAGDQLLTKLQGARLQAALGAHDQAIGLLDECETLCDPSMRRVLLEILAVRRGSLVELGRVDEAEAVLVRAQAVAAEIGSLISDSELRAAFEIGSAELLSS
jgi:tetratricopeptide (TPR) repeat protein